MSLIEVSAILRYLRIYFNVFILPVVYAFIMIIDIVIEVALAFCRNLMRYKAVLVRLL